jgi:isoquinoline 1-oxidoreductase beta subunit
MGAQRAAQSGAAPAVANAIAAATGKRLRRLPFDTEALKA